MYEIFANTFYIYIKIVKEAEASEFSVLSFNSLSWQRQI